MTDTLDLTERLAEAAADAVRARRKALEDGGARNLRGITVEIETANNGAVLDVTSYLSWKQTTRATGGLTMQQDDPHGAQATRERIALTNAIARGLMASELLSRAGGGGSRVVIDWRALPIERLEALIQDMSADPDFALPAFALAAIAASIREGGHANVQAWELAPLVTAIGPAPGGLDLSLVDGPGLACLDADQIIGDVERGLRELRG